jgi:hypothetical protein
MPDPTPPPTPEPEKNKRPRGILNQAQIQALTKADQICLAAKKGAYAPKLSGREIEPGFVDTLLDDIKSARKKASDAVHGTSGKESSSLSEDNTEKELVIALQEIQSAAKQKYARTDPPRLQDYYVGTRLNANRAMLEQASQGMINQLQNDTLPGITPIKIANLETMRQAYVGANATQGDMQSGATTDRRSLEDMIHSITDRRVTIQFAADAEWPYSDDMNHAIRKEFYLPLSQPFNG